VKVLLLDPDHGTGRTIEAVFARGELAVAGSQGEGLRLAAAGGWDAILLDAEFSGGAGMDLLSRFRSAGSAPVVLLARSPSMELTLEAIQRGAHEVLAKPVRVERLREVLAGLAVTREIRPLPERIRGPDDLVGSSPEMLAVFMTVARAAASDATVLVLGESGTGKELIARVLHARSRRARHPFVAINCAAIPENLLESELFGHEKGAFTGAIGRRIGRFERAHGGTLFLDEIADMSLALQAKILRALQEREVERVGSSATIPIDLRVVAATNQDLASAVAEGRFREDLFYRLSVVNVRLPPLRSRGEDLDLLAEHFAALHARAHGRPVRALAEETLRVLRACPWPGNVRQLRNAMERAVVMCEGEVLLPRHLPLDVRRPEVRPGALSVPEEPLCTLEEMERRMIRRALQDCGHNLTAAAERLGIHRNTLRRKITDYGLAQG
jgi:DNA-binding NtrC family response regulator